MLDKHLIVKTAPKANPENMAFWKDYRVTVLGDRIFRLEKSENKRFRDEATTRIWFRNVAKQDFSVDATENDLTIKTSCVTLVIKEDREDCYAIIDGHKKALDNSENLKGTARTLDGYNGDTFNDTGKLITLEDGVCSLSGIAVLDDSKSEVLNDCGEIEKRYAEGTDEYIFAFGNDYRGAIKALYAICGSVPIIPRFALGNWWSRCKKYSDEEYLICLHRFEEHEVPLSVATIDMDWHYSAQLDEQKGITKSGRNTPFYGGNCGWTGYSWNTELFPDHKKFLKQVREKGLKVTLNLHPADGVRWFEDSYSDMAKAMGKDPTVGEKIAFDIFNPVFVNAYFSVLHRPHENDGVNFWWIDWQQGTVAGSLGIDPLWALNHYHYLDNNQNGEGLILSRYAGVGSHRYPLGFSGDTIRSWKTLQYLPCFTATASNVGYGWWSHDIGGYYDGEQNNEMYLRFVQYGIFSPISRYHSAGSFTKEPWAYLNGACAIACDFMRFRHKLVPFLYTCAYAANKNADMLVEPLYYYHQKESEAYKYKNEYYFGKTLLVAPIVTPEEKDGYARVNVWLPKGNWTDIFTGDMYSIEKEEGEKKTLLRTLESIPVLAKSGTILPLSEDKGNGTSNPVKMTVKVFNGNGKFEMYEDGIESGIQGEFFTLFETSENAAESGMKIQSLKISSRGESAVIPKNRTISVRFENIEKGETSVFINGKKVENERIYADCVICDLDFAANNVYEITVKYKILSKLDMWKKRAEKIIVESEGPTVPNRKAKVEIAAITDIKEAYSDAPFKNIQIPAVIERLRETL